MAKQLGAIARAEGISVSQVLREGIENHITARCSDENLLVRVFFRAMKEAGPEPAPA